MIIKRLLIGAVTLVAAGAATVYGIQSANAATYPGPGVVTGSTFAHDPAMVKRPAGGYLLAVTAPGIGLKTSTDRTAFADAGVAFPNGAPWTLPYTKGDTNLWAPDLTYRNGQYWLYYSASSFGGNTSAIFLATSTTGAAGSWVNRGLVIESRSTDTFNAIDPNLFIDGDGSWWLSFGSFWGGIKMIRLNGGTGLRTPTDTAVRPLAERFVNSKSVEAPFVYKRGGYYYLFVAFDLCCRGASSTYRTMVGRAKSITGPYVDRNGTPMTAGGGTEIMATHDAVHGPGHPAVLRDGDQDVLIYHYYTPAGDAKLGINLLRWDSAGWPAAY
ncbi:MULTISPECIES: arabinan endo-1,5-alpha-L-arabinosidase [Catenuloplanes]|uniref:Arabinan endo-1,5-alpha-L-arabinosidase n=1 Tax=Catenuloplanes niger TaxID=587534 RepID=A0AAE3ZQC2_9ACTN|nr:arabinan endo-1,5-alpha-L-arabinosidase [Catenuloplanes niger]MDR7322298.1 arabinan endo-1,5-alpha-L-arabinosidase [Catenuloplanes niger]